MSAFPKVWTSWAQRTCDMIEARDSPLGVDKNGRRSFVDQAIDICASVDLYHTFFWLWIEKPQQLLSSITSLTALTTKSPPIMNAPNTFISGALTPLTPYSASSGDPSSSCSSPPTYLTTSSPVTEPLGDQLLTQLPLLAFSEHSIGSELEEL